MCHNCGWLPVRATTELCVPCWRYERRTGRPRPARVVLRHLERRIEKELMAL
jgi:hypothetical protein